MAFKRVREAIPRKRFVQVRCSDAEYARLAGAAAVAGLPMARVLWEAFDVGGNRAAVELRILNDGVDRFNSLVAATARNINQLAKHANATGVAPVETAATLASMDVLGEKLTALVAEARAAAIGRSRAAAERGAVAP